MKKVYWTFGQPLNCYCISDPVTTKNCKIAGWGRLSSEPGKKAPVPTRLYEAKLKVKARDTCLAGIFL